MRRIAVIFAMHAEAEPLLAALGATPLESPPIAAGLPGRWHRTTRAGAEVIIAVNGIDARHGVDAIGTVPAALTTFVTLRHWPVDLVVSAGAAGGWARAGAEIGTVYVSRDRFVYHDRRIALPRFDEYGIGSFPALDTSRLAQALHLEHGVVTTGNSLDETDDDRRLIAATGAQVKDMEAAAVAETATLLGVPVLAVKAITDLVDSHADTAEQFVANLAQASRRLCEAMVAVLDWCAGKEVADLGGIA